MPGFLARFLGSHRSASRERRASKSLPRPAMTEGLLTPLPRVAAGGAPRRASWDGPLPEAPAPAFPYPLEPNAEQLRALYSWGSSRRKAYQDVRVLGSGSEGTVKLCRCIDNGAMVALKAMNKPPAPGNRGGRAGTQMAETRAAFERSIRERFFAVKSHNGHPHMPFYIELFETEEKIYLVTTVCEGGTLQKYILDQGGELDESEALFIASMIFGTLAYAHGAGLVHRDLKPANIMLKEAGNLDSLVIMDWDGCHVGPPVIPGEEQEECLAETWQFVGSGNDAWAGKGAQTAEAEIASTSVGSSGAVMQTLVGTPFYLAPEVVAGKSYTAKVDVWSAGCIVYEMLYGETPFQASGSFTELFTRICRGAYTIPPGYDHVSPAAANFVREVLEPDPSLRLGAFQALQHPWILGTVPGSKHHRTSSGVEVFFRSDSKTLDLALPLVSAGMMEHLARPRRSNTVALDAVTVG
ncbi:kinase-like domain-containing protein [Hyaloraphidium curvatum]|nr:kinase-like domain-containing protein [Hyaloraphidium curvatum]